jgi:RNA polymerase sigma factor (sigma-70 family)
MISGTDSLQSEADEPWQHLAAVESCAWVTLALQKLRESDREILVLRYGHDLGSRAIGEQLSINADAVDMRLSRARRRLLKAFVGLESGRRRTRSGVVPLG